VSSRIRTTPPVVLGTAALQLFSPTAQPRVVAAQVTAAAQVPVALQVPLLQVAVAAPVVPVRSCTLTVAPLAPLGTLALHWLAPCVQPTVPDVQACCEVAQLPVATQAPLLQVA